MQAQRERILRATLTCIATLGIERTSVAAICAEAALSAGAVYTHFASKEEIVAAALGFGSTGAAAMPDSWPALKDWIAGTDDELELDFATVARTQLQVIASSMRPGAPGDALRPLIERSLAAVVDHLAAMEAAGRVRLRLPPLETALAIAALKDGLSWLALARGRPPAEVRDTLLFCLDRLVAD